MCFPDASMIHGGLCLPDIGRRANQRLRQAFTIEIVACAPIQASSSGLVLVWLVKPFPVVPQVATEVKRQRGFAWRESAYEGVAFMSARMATMSLAEPDDGDAPHLRFALCGFFHQRRERDAVGAALRIGDAIRDCFHARGGSLGFQVGHWLLPDSGRADVDRADVDSDRSLRSILAQRGEEKRWQCLSLNSVHS